MGGLRFYTVHILCAYVSCKYFKFAFLRTAMSRYKDLKSKWVTHHGLTWQMGEKKINPTKTIQSTGVGG